MKFLRTLVFAGALSASLAAGNATQVSFDGNAAMWTMSMNGFLQAMHSSMGSTLGSNTKNIDELHKGVHTTSLNLNKIAALNAVRTSTIASPNSSTAPLPSTYGSAMSTPVTGMPASKSIMSTTGIDGLPISTTAQLPALVTMLPAESLGSVSAMASSYASTPGASTSYSTLSSALGAAPAGTQVGDSAFVRTMTPQDVSYMTAVQAGTPQAMADFYAANSPGEGLVYHPLAGGPVPAMGGETATAVALLRHRIPVAARIADRLLGSLLAPFLPSAYAQTTSLAQNSAVLGLPAGATPSNQVMITGLSASQMAKWNNWVSENNAAIQTNAANTSWCQQMLVYLDGVATGLAQVQSSLAGISSGMVHQTALPQAAQMQMATANMQIAVTEDKNHVLEQINANNMNLHNLLVARDTEHSKYAALSQAEAGSKQAALLTSLAGGAGSATTTAASAAAAPAAMTSGVTPVNTAAY